MKVTHRVMPSDGTNSFAQQPGRTAYQHRAEEAERRPQPEVPKVHPRGHEDVVRIRRELDVALGTLVLAKRSRQTCAGRRTRSAIARNTT